MKNPLKAIAGITIVILALALTGCGNESDKIGPPLTTGLYGVPIIPDTTPPYVLTTFPSGTVGTGTTIQVTFSEAMDPTTVTADGSFVVMVNSGVYSGSHVSGTLTWISSSQVQFTPSTPLLGSTDYLARITTLARDLSGNALLVEVVWSFATGATSDTTAPFVTAATPTTGATDVSIHTLITVGFSEALDNTTVTTGSFLLSSVTGTVSSAGSTAIFYPGAPLASNTTYTVTLTSAIKDASTTNALAPTVWSFRTAAAPLITTTTLPEGTETGLYSAGSFTLTATGGRPRTWSTASALPSGLNLSSAGVLSGTLAASTAGAYPLDITATDDDGLFSSQTLTLTVNPLPTVTTAALPPAQVSVDYGPVTLTATGGTTPYGIWSATGLPAGLSFNTGTGTISGIPGPGTDVGSPYSIDITVTDANGVVSAIVTLPLTVAP
jgi:hypothetical protein